MKIEGSCVTFEPCDAAFVKEVRTVRSSKYGFWITILSAPICHFFMMPSSWPVSLT